MQSIKLKIIGIHCKSCKELIESEIGVLRGVKDIALNVKTSKAIIEYNNQQISEHEIIKEIENLNYEVKVISGSENIANSDRKNTNINEGSPFSKKIMIPIVALLLIGLLYFMVDRFGFLELLGKLNEPNLSYPLIFVIGILASFHCIGMCGGIVMAYTSRFCTSVKGNKSISLPHINYNLGRILSYALTGVVLGGIGSFFGINNYFTGVITLLAGLFMIAVGLSLLAKFSILDRITNVLPSSYARFFSSQLHTSKPRAPFVIGFLNGFMPCGPLQALQIYALSSGSALTGGLSMAAYGLGTAPLMLGFGNIISMFSLARMKQVMKISGIIVILLGLLTINRGLGSFNASGSNQPAVKTEISTKSDNPAKNNGSNQENNFQVAKMDLTYQGYVPSTLTVKKGIPVKWVINVKEMSGCTSEILFPAHNIEKRLKKGENVIEFIPQAAGTFKFSCGMQMVWGKFIVTE